MASNINPSLTPVNSLDNFRFWCQKVLPLVYDDSLSYYEVLGKMVIQLNDVIDNVNADTDNVLTLKDAFLELQTYVNNFFDDIDQLASYAERAEAAQTAANTSAINAATSASNASASSLAAMDARDTAVAARQAAQASANTASTAATNANTKANEAAQSAITAQTAQASASQSATLAATDRSAAQTAASTATTKANEANTSATNAETSAENAAQSESNAEELVNNIQENLDNIQQNTQDISNLKESLMDVSEDLNIAYVTNGITFTKHGLTFKYINDYKVAVYGTSSQITNASLFNGNWESLSSGSSSFAYKPFEAGTYTFYLKVTIPESVSGIPYFCYTTSNITNRVEINPRINNTITIDSDFCLLFRMAGNKYYGTEENPTYFELGVYKGEVNFDDVILEKETAIDYVARNKLSKFATSPYDHGEFSAFKSDFSKWYSGLQADYTTEGFSANTTYAEVISAFDALAALAPDYITKTELGTASGTDSSDNAYKIYEYSFTPKNYNIELNPKKRTVILLDGSIHGFEKCSTFGLYFFLKDLVQNYDDNDSLMNLRFGVDIKIIPVVNPYGFDNNTYKNANNVNINRNFAHPGEWVVVLDGSDQNGLAAFDQPESAIVRDWILANEANLLFYADCHTNGQYNAGSYSEMNACMTSSDRNDTYYNRIFSVFDRHIEEQTLRWPNMYPTKIQLTASEFCGKNQSSPTSDATKGTASAWANTMRTNLSMTLEGFNGVSIDSVSKIDLFSADAFKINSENIGNMVMQMLREFVED